MVRYNWAILGCGKIASKFASDLKSLPQANLYAAASRSLAKAEEFSQRFGFQKAFGSYEELVKDPEVDIVYIATPHSHHHEHALLCLKHGKATLVEKAFALDAVQAREMITAARQNQVFLMEAFWTILQPAYIKAMSVLQSGILGDARMMRSEFCFYSPYNPATRLFDPALGGGSLLDIGIYPVFWAQQIFGVPSDIKVSAKLAPTGVDQSLAMIFTYPDGRTAQLSSSFEVCSDTQTEIWCEKGFIRIRRTDPHSMSVTISIKGVSEETEMFRFENQFGLFLEARHVMECLDQGLSESPLLPLSFTLQQMDLLDRIRGIAGVHYETNPKR
jgi:predicted dehydrogenase